MPYLKRHLIKSAHLKPSELHPMHNSSQNRYFCIVIGHSPSHMKEKYSASICLHHHSYDEMCIVEIQLNNFNCQCDGII